MVKFLLHAIALLAAFQQVWVVDAKIDRDAHHAHRGTMKPYSPGPFGMAIESDEENVLEKGNPLMKQLPPDDPADKLGGKAICVQDVAAPKSAVWSQILDMDRYVGKVNKVKECNNYLVKDNGDGTMQVKTKMVLGVMPGYSVRINRQRKDVHERTHLNTFLTRCVNFVVFQICSPKSNNYLSPISA